MWGYKYIVLMIPMDWAFEIKKIFKNKNWILQEYNINNNHDLKLTLDSFWNDGQKIYNFLTNLKAMRWIKLVVDKVDDFIIPEWMYAEFIDEDKLNWDWTERMWNTAVFPLYHMDSNRILI